MGQYTPKSIADQGLPQVTPIPNMKAFDSILHVLERSRENLCGGRGCGRGHGQSNVPPISFGVIHHYIIDNVMMHDVMMYDVMMMM